MLSQKNTTRQAVVAVAAVLAFAHSARAQSQPSIPDPNSVHMRLGPVWAKPTFTVTNLGVDTNILNKAEGDRPQSDFGATVSPTANLWLPVRMTWVSGSVKEDLFWYRKSSSERSARTSYFLGWTVPLSRLTFSTSGNWLNTRERPGYEIDARADRRERQYAGGVEVRALSKTFFGVRSEWQSIDFVNGQLFLGRDLNTELKHKTISHNLTARYELTPLTSLTFDAGTNRDRFDLSPGRDANSTQMSVGLAFSADALLSGSAKIGFRKFNPIGADVPDYSGATTAMQLSYAATNTTKVAWQSSRDVQFSFETNQPYYLLTGFTASVQQRVFGPFDVEGRLGRQRLSYRDRQGVVVSIVGRVDHMRSYGAGVGFNMGDDLRLGFNLDRQSRISDVLNRNYAGWRFGMTTSYGL